MDLTQLEKIIRLMIYNKVGTFIYLLKSMHGMLLVVRIPNQVCEVATDIHYGNRKCETWKKIIYVLQMECGYKEQYLKSSMKMPFIYR